MKKIILFFIVTFSFAQIIGLSDLLSTILPKIVHKKVIKVYTIPKYYNYFKSKNFIIVKECKECDIVFGNILCDNKPVFALSYDFYKNHKNVFGVFYFRKGRPQLKFKEKALLRFFKTIPKELEEYVE